MKIFLTILIVGIVGLIGWALWPNNGTNVAYTSVSPEVTADNSATFATETPVPVNPASTPSATTAPTKTPVPAVGGTGTAPARAPLFANLSAQSGSDEYGVAALTANSNDLAVISFNMAGFPMSGFGSQNAYIVNGTCTNMGSIAYNLTPLNAGYSTTTLNANFLDIAQNKGSYSIVVYGQNNQVPFACGQLQ